MGRRLHYRMGSFYRVDDRTGFPQRAEDTREEWTGLIVDRARWEIRQPQDFVRGVKDDQSVPKPRPLPTNSFVGPIATQLTANAAVAATVISVQSVSGFTIGDPIGVMLDTWQIFRTTLAGIGSSSLTLAAKLPFTAALGNNVFDFVTDIPPPPFGNQSA